MAGSVGSLAGKRARGAAKGTMTVTADRADGVMSAPSMPKQISVGDVDFTLSLMSDGRIRADGSASLGGSIVGNLDTALFTDDPQVDITYSENSSTPSYAVQVSGWDAIANISNDVYDFAEDIIATHPDLGEVSGNVSDGIFVADTYRGLREFLKAFGMGTSDVGDI